MGGASCPAGGAGAGAADLTGLGWAAGVDAPVAFAAVALGLAGLTKRRRPGAGLGLDMA